MGHTASDITESTETSAASANGENAQSAATAWLSVIEEKVNKLRFGIVQITIHDGRVVQIDSTERTRLDVSGENPRRPRSGVARTAEKKAS